MFIYGKVEISKKVTLQAYHCFLQVTLTNHQWQPVFVEFDQRQRNWKPRSSWIPFQSIFSVLYCFIVCALYHDLRFVFPTVFGQSISSTRYYSRRRNKCWKRWKASIWSWNAWEKNHQFFYALFQIGLAEFL